jgi:hypothetical protein
MAGKTKADPPPAVPPIPHADVHRKLIRDLRAMSATEVEKTLVDAGIVDQKGRLTKAYRD